jgi:hypothetical protein
MAIPLAAALSSFREYYHDITQDEHNHAHAPLMQAFAVPTGHNPATLRDLSTNNPEATSVGHLVLCQANQLPYGTAGHLAPPVTLWAPKSRLP